jgi:hypothetical protein
VAVQVTRLITSARVSWRFILSSKGLRLAVNIKGILCNSLTSVWFVVSTALTLDGCKQHTSRKPVCPPFLRHFSHYSPKESKEIQVHLRKHQLVPSAFGEHPKFSKTRYCCSNPLISGLFNSKEKLTWHSQYSVQPGNCLSHSSSRLRRFITVHTNFMFMGPYITYQCQ